MPLKVEIYHSVFVPRHAAAGTAAFSAAAERRLMLTPPSGYLGQDRRFVMIFGGRNVNLDAMGNGAPPHSLWHLHWRFYRTGRLNSHPL